MPKPTRPRKPTLPEESTPLPLLEPELHILHAPEKSYPRLYPAPCSMSDGPEAIFPPSSTSAAAAATTSGDEEDENQSVKAYTYELFDIILIPPPTTDSTPPDSIHPTFQWLLGPAPEAHDEDDDENEDEDGPESDSTNKPVTSPYFPGARIIQVSYPPPTPLVHMSGLENLAGNICGLVMHVGLKGGNVVVKNKKKKEVVEDGVDAEEGDGEEDEEVEEDQEEEEEEEEEDGEEPTTRFPEVQLMTDIQRPVVLIGDGFGSVVVKSMLMIIHNNTTAFMTLASSLRKVIIYTPPPDGPPIPLPGCGTDPDLTDSQRQWQHDRLAAIVSTAGERFIDVQKECDLLTLTTGSGNTDEAADENDDDNGDNSDEILDLVSKIAISVHDVPIQAMTIPGVGLPPKIAQEVGYCAEHWRPEKGAMELRRRMAKGNVMLLAGLAGEMAGERGGRVPWPQDMMPDGDCGDYDELYGDVLAGIIDGEEEEDGDSRRRVRVNHVYNERYRCVQDNEDAEPFLPDELTQVSSTSAPHTELPGAIGLYALQVQDAMVLRYYFDKSVTSGRDAVDRMLKIFIAQALGQDKGSFWCTGVPGQYITLEDNGIWGEREMWVFLGEILAGCFAIERADQEKREKKLVIVVEGVEEVDGEVDVLNGLAWLGERYVPKDVEVRIVVVHPQGMGRKQEDGKVDRGVDTSAMAKLWEEPRKLEEMKVDDGANEKPSQLADIGTQQQADEVWKEIFTASLAHDDLPSPGEEARGIILKILPWVATAQQPLGILLKLSTILQETKDQNGFLTSVNGALKGNGGVGSPLSATVNGTIVLKHGTLLRRLVLNLEPGNNDVDPVLAGKVSEVVRKQHARFAEVCINFLLHPSKIDHSETRNGLYDYAAQYWGHHLRLAGPLPAQTASLAWELLHNIDVLKAWRKAYWDIRMVEGQSPQPTGMEPGVYLEGIDESLEKFEERRGIRLQHRYVPPRAEEAFGIIAHFGAWELLWTESRGKGEVGGDIEVVERAVVQAIQEGHDITPNGQVLRTIISACCGKEAGPEDLKRIYSSALQTAARFGREKTVVQFLPFCFEDAEAVNEAIIHATLNGHASIVRYILLTAPATIIDHEYLSPDTAMTALHTALDARQHLVIPILLSAQPRQNLPQLLQFEPPTGQGPALFKAISSNSNLTVSSLLSSYPSPGLLVQHITTLRSSDDADLTPIAHACQRHAPNSLRLLLSHLPPGAQHLPINEHQRTPLHTAAQVDSPACAMVLLQEFAAPTEIRDGIGYTPLAVAVTEGNPAVASVLLGYGADPSFEISFGGGVNKGLLHGAHSCVDLARLLTHFSGSKAPGTLGADSVAAAQGILNPVYSSLHKPGVVRVLLDAGYRGVFNIPVTSTHGAEINNTILLALRYDFMATLEMLLATLEEQADVQKYVKQAKSLSLVYDCASAFLWLYEKHGIHPGETLRSMGTSPGPPITHEHLPRIYSLISEKVAGWVDQWFIEAEEMESTGSKDLHALKTDIATFFRNGGPAIFDGLFSEYVAEDRVDDVEKLIMVTGARAWEWRDACGRNGAGVARSDRMRKLFFPDKWKGNGGIKKKASFKTTSCARIRQYAGNEWREISVTCRICEAVVTSGFVYHCCVRHTTKEKCDYDVCHACVLNDKRVLDRCKMKTREHTVMKQFVWKGLWSFEELVGKDIERFAVPGWYEEEQAEGEEAEEGEEEEVEGQGEEEEEEEVEEGEWDDEEEEDGK